MPPEERHSSVLQRKRASFTLGGGGLEKYLDIKMVFVI